MSTHNLCFVKFSVYLNRPVFVMIGFHFCKHISFITLCILYLKIKCHIREGRHL